MHAVKFSLFLPPGDFDEARAAAEWADAHGFDAARSVAIGMADEGLFVTLFHARLDPGSGRVAYVDAGHGHCAILRADGELARLGAGSLPLGVRDDEVYREATAHLRPGDTLLAWSDGLVERPERTVGLRDLAPDLDPSESAHALVARFMAGTPPRPEDDVTVLALRRTADA